MLLVWCHLKDHAYFSIGCSSLGASLNLWACNKHGERLQEMHLGRTVRSPLTDVRRGFGINIPRRGFE